MKAKEILRCSPVDTYLYYCEKSKFGYYYEAYTKRCVSTTDYLHYICHCNGNRFKYLHECEQYCIKRPKDFKCFQPKYFAPCNETKLEPDFWFLNTKRTMCQRWGYKEGKCPTNPEGHTQYYTYDSCQKNCVNKKNPPPGCIHEHKGGICNHTLMNEPYFMYVHSDGIRRCHQVTYETMKDHHCVDEDKRFDTLEECNKVCKNLLPGKRRKRWTNFLKAAGIRPTQRPECPAKEEYRCRTRGLKEIIKDVTYAPGCPRPDY
ncbi:papilin-like [Amblyomma americanum]